MKEAVTMPGYMGKPWAVTGDAQNGLILHKMGKSYHIAHIATGMRIGYRRSLKRDAKRVFAALLALPVDWTCETIEEIAASGNMDVRGLRDAVKLIAY